MTKNRQREVKVGTGKVHRLLIAPSALLPARLLQYLVVDPVNRNLYHMNKTLLITKKTLTLTYNNII